MAAYNSSDYGNYSDEYGIYGSAEISKIYFVFAIVASLVGIVIIIGNLLVIISVIKFHTLRTSTNSIIASLAVADLCVGVILVPIFSMYGTEYAASLIFTCVAHIFDNGLCTVSVIHILAVNIDRYIAITRPLTYQTIVTDKLVCGVIIFMWVFGLGLFILPFVFFEDARMYCYPISIGYRIYFKIAYGGFNLLAMVLVILIYIHIFRIGLRHIKAVHIAENALATSKPNSTSVAHWKMIQTIGFVLGIFIICWAPFILYFFSLSHEATYTLDSMIMIYSFALTGIANSAVNPIIYASTQKQFRNAFKKLLRCQMTKTDRESSQTSYTN